MAVIVRDSTWLYPIVETIHIAGFVVLVGAAVMFDLRLLGFSRLVRVTDLARHVLPWSRWSVAPVFLSGLLLFMTQPVEMAGNATFRAKLALILLAGVNAFVFHQWTFKSVDRWDRAVATPAPAKAAGLLSLTIWAGVISCGRFLAYL